MNLDLRGPQGILEAVLDEPRGRASGAVAVVCHPHPLFDGTMHNKVAYWLARGLCSAGHIVLRFNFRGVGRSAGDHDGGKGEVDDLRAAVSFLLDRVGGGRLLLAGYSFGAHVASALFAEDRRAESYLGVGLAVRLASFEHLVACQKPKTCVVASEDVFGSLDDFRAVFDRMACPKELRPVMGADHSFEGHFPEIEEIARTVGLAHAALLSSAIS